MAQNRARRAKKRSAIYAPLTFLIVCAALVFAVGVFFRVVTIEVTGAGYYSPEEIIEASGIEEGDNLFFINRFSAASRIFSKLPYVQSVTVSRSLPNRVVITVAEAVKAAYIQDGADYWIFDSSCKLLDVVTVDEARDLIRVTGVSLRSPAVGETLSAETGETATVQYLTDMLSAICSLDMLSDVTYIDMSNLSDPSFDYLGRFTVKLGADTDVAYKLELLLSAVEQLSPEDEGLIDLSLDNKAHFSPY